jgi:hypothetical protein
MSEPQFECCVWQRGAKWHWQCKNGFDQVLASGVTESDVAARIAAASAFAGDFAHHPFRAFMIARIVHAPFAELVRLSRTSIADEMRIEHTRRVLGE